MEVAWWVIRLLSLAYFFIWGAIAYYFGEAPIKFLGGNFGMLGIFLPWILFFVAPVIVFTGYAGESQAPSPISKIGSTAESSTSGGRTFSGGGVHTDDYVGFDSDGDGD